jgi:uronate dehydrogenase
VKLVCVGLKVRDLHFEVVYGISNNDRAWWDNRRAYELGYQPQDNAETYAAEILSLEKPEDVDDVAHQFQGGVFTSAGFNGDVQKID